MGMYYNFTNVELTRMGEGPARISQIAPTKVVYVDGEGAEQFVDLEESARACIVLEKTGAWPPPADLDWTAYASSHTELVSHDVGRRLVGMRGAADNPPWFQFFDRRRTLFEFKNYDTIYAQLITPLARHGWQTWDGS